MTQTVSDYFSIWQCARLAHAQFASRIDSEDKADEQFVIQQHAIRMMAKLPARNSLELQMKIRVALLEADLHPESNRAVTDEARLIGNILIEVDQLLSDEENENAEQQYS